ncbi:MAG: Rieske (2Fe-2S) protein, partial [Bacteroidetes bacterium]
MGKTKWIKIFDQASDLPDSRVVTVSAGTKEICLTNHEGKICALDNKCPHQGGPLGEGSIEN